MDWKRKSFDDFKRHSKTKSDTIYNQSEGIKPTINYKKELEEYKESVEYVKEHFAPKENRKNKKLTDEQVIEIRKRWLGEGSVELAKIFGVSRSCIEQAAKGFTYQHLNYKHKPWV